MWNLARGKNKVQFCTHTQTVSSYGCALIALEGGWVDKEPNHKRGKYFVDNFCYFHLIGKFFMNLTRQTVPVVAEKFTTSSVRKKIEHLT